MTASGLTARPANDDVSQHAGLAVPDTGGACGTVFLSVPAGHHVADLLRGPFLRSVLAARPCPKIVVLSPFASDGRLAAELDGVGVECQPLPDVRPRVAARVVDSVLSEKFLLIFPGESGQVDYAAHVTFRTCRLSNALGLRYPSDECSRYGL